MKKLLVISILGILALGFQQRNNFEAGEHKNEICLSPVEMELYNAINDYRKSKKLSVIPLSHSLTIVAQSHSIDLSENYKRSKRCNLHSWSAEGEWSSCCYTNDHKQAACMWNKPRELTEYDSEGYEIAFAKYRSDNSIPDLSAEEALEGWQESRGHNWVMINKGSFKDLEWNAMGVGMQGGYASVWFGSIEDEMGGVEICD